MNALEDKAYKLCLEIEKLPSSATQTELSIMSYDLYKAAKNGRDELMRLKDIISSITQHYYWWYRHGTSNTAATELHDAITTLKNAAASTEEPIGPAGYTASRDVIGPTGDAKPVYPVTFRCKAETADFLAGIFGDSRSHFLL